MTDPNATPPVFCGLVLVDKPLGLSSMEVVRRVRRAASAYLEQELAQPRTGRKAKVKTGHAGTLDPLATGLVICCLGKATKTVDRLMDLTKVYEARVDLSAFTTTDDREGPRHEVRITQQPTMEAIRAACATFEGSIQQTPPAFSAIHVGGQRAYKLARRGEAPVMPPRTVSVQRVEVLDYAWPELGLRITCGKGTYIRSLARDLGVRLGTGGHLAELRRVAVGAYHVEAALPIERFQSPLGPEALRPTPA